MTSPSTGYRTPSPVQVGDREPISRAIDVLTWIADHPKDQCRVRHVARDLGTSPSTIHRVFRVLESRGLLERSPDGYYMPTLELYRVCQALVSRWSPARIAHPHLEALADRCGEAVLLAVYDSNRAQVIFVDLVQTQHTVRHIIELNQWVPVHAGASGLAAFAFLSESERARVYERGLEAVTDLTLVNPEDIEREVARWRKLGYVSTTGQRTTGAVGIGAPVYDADGAVYGNVCITVPAQRYSEDVEPFLAAAVMETSTAISADFRRTGYRRSSAAG